MTTPSKIKEQKVNLYRFGNDMMDLPAKEYFLTFKDTIPSSIHFDELKSEIREELTKNGWQQFFYCESYSPKSDPYSGVSFWIKKDFYLNLSIHSRGERCNATLAFPHNHPKIEVEEEVKFIASYISKSSESKFYILIKEDYGFNVRDFTVKIPENADLSVNYGEGFLSVHENIKAKLSSEDSGLFILHGSPGCGKSTYIKKLAGEIPHKKFVYIPEFMISMLNNPEMIGLFIEHQNSVLVIEDAEKIIMNRESDSSSLVSIILNISDGILSDILKIPIILTYNTETENVDSALLRKGRLKYKHEFKPLSEKEAIKVLKKNKVSDKQIEQLKSEGKIKEGMSIADVFFISEDVGEIKEEKKPTLGFGV